MFVRLPAEFDTIQSSRENEILHALRHHERALACVQEAGVQRLPLETRRKLLTVLTAGLNALEGEMERRGINPLTQPPDLR